MILEDEEKRIRDGAVAAAKLIRTHGWIQGNFGGPAGGFCLAGAVNYVFGWDSVSVIKVLTRCYRVISHRPVDEAGSCPVAVWNDRKGRRKREVLAVLDRVARGGGKGRG